MKAIIENSANLDRKFVRCDEYGGVETYEEEIFWGGKYLGTITMCEDEEKCWFEVVGNYRERDASSWEEAISKLKYLNTL